MTETPKTKTTAKERAVEAVAVLQRRLAKLTNKKAELQVDVNELTDAIADVQAQLLYAEANPLLKETPTTPATTASTGGHFGGGPS